MTVRDPMSWKMGLFGVGRRTTDLLMLTTLIGLAFLLYFHETPIPYYEDDFGLVFESDSCNPFFYFVNSTAHGSFYRPIEASVLALIQRHFGMETLPLNMLQVTMHLSFCF